MFKSSRKFIVSRYDENYRGEWNRFLEGSKNSTFLFHRNYVEYHSDRFTDHSLLVFDEDELVALLPANLGQPGNLESHGGLTYGGLVFSKSVSLVMTLEIFKAILEYLVFVNIECLLYKRIPRFYNSISDDEVDYALFLVGADLYRRDCALVIDMQDRLPITRRRQREIRKAERAAVKIVETNDYSAFWLNVLTPRLEGRFGVKPVHSLTEIELLASRFPNCIRQFVATQDGCVLAGITIFETEQVAHVQYSAMTEAGQRCGALDSLVHTLLDQTFCHKRYFDFGISNEDGGRRLNFGLLDWKEGFGARSSVHDFYRIRTNEHHRLDTALPDYRAVSNGI